MQLIVQEIAKSLKIFPKLLRGLNALLEDDYQIEFSTHVDEASYFLFVDPIDARILSTSCSSVPKPSSKAELWEVLSTPGLKDLGDKGGSTDWLCCLAQLLQVVCLPSRRKRMGSLKFSYLGFRSRTHTFPIQTQSSSLLIQISKTINIASLPVFEQCHAGRRGGVRWRICGDFLSRALIIRGGA